MKATRVYAAKHKLAQEAQDACTKIVVMAERRIGQAIVEARRRGELAASGQQDRARDSLPDGTAIPATLAAVGISRM